MCQVSPSQKTEKHVFIFLRVPRDKTRPGRAVGAPQSSPAEAGPHPSLLPAACGAPSCPEESPTPAGGRSASPLSSLSFRPRPLCSSSARLVALSHAAVLVWCAHTHASFLTSLAYLLISPISPYLLNAGQYWDGLPFPLRQWHPTPVLLPGESHGQRSLVGCSPWGP